MHYIAGIWPTSSHLIKLNSSFLDATQFINVLTHNHFLRYCACATLAEMKKKQDGSVFNYSHHQPQKNQCGGGCAHLLQSESVDS